MIFGSITVKGNAVQTHRDSYLLSQLSVVSVRRPFLATAMILGSGLIGFAVAFGDLLYAGEIIMLAGLAIAGLVVGWEAGQLKLLSRDLRGSELSGVIWGRYAALNAKRHAIVDAIRTSQSETNNGGRS